MNFGGGTLTVDATRRSPTMPPRFAGGSFVGSSGGTPNTATFDQSPSPRNTATDRGIGGLGYDPDRRAPHPGDDRRRQLGGRGRPNCGSAGARSRRPQRRDRVRLRLHARTGPAGHGPRLGPRPRVPRRRHDVCPLAIDSPAVNLSRPATAAISAASRARRARGATPARSSSIRDPDRLRPARPDQGRAPQVRVLLDGDRRVPAAASTAPTAQSGTYAPCTSPWRAPDLARRRSYSFEVAALIDGAPIDHGEPHFTVDTHAPEAPAITSPKPGTTCADVVLSGTASRSRRCKVREGDGTRPSTDRRPGRDG